MAIVTIKKSDLLAGGVEDSLDLIPTADFTLPGAGLAIPVEISPGTYTVVASTLSGAGAVEGTEVTVAVDGAVLGSLHVTNALQYINFTAPSDGSRIDIKHKGSTVPLTVRGLKMYKGELNNEVVNLTPKKCKEKKQVNVAGWSVDLEFDLKHKQHIQQGFIVEVETKSKGIQPFRMNNPEVLNRTVRVTAEHVFFDTRQFHIENVHVASGTAALALSQLNKATDHLSPFKTNSTVELARDADFIRVSYYDAIVEILKLWGGKLDIDKWSFTLRDQMGEDRGEEIVYGKNSEGVKVYENWDGVVTKIFPYGDGNFTLPERYINASVQYSTIYSRGVEFRFTVPTEIEDSEGNKVPNTLDMEYDLRNQATSYLESSQYPKLAYQITSNINEDLELWDTVKVKHPALTSELPTSGPITEEMISATYIPIEVMAYEYDVLERRVTRLEYGDYSLSIKGALGSLVTKPVQDLEHKLIDQEGKLKEQTDLINGLNKNGHVVVMDNEILLLDKLPKETAQYVWKLGVGGIGLSSTGINGTFTTAWDQEGHFNADVITAGTLEGTLLKVGSIQSESLSLEAVEFIMNLTKIGGNNLLKNSVGYGGWKAPWRRLSGRSAWEPTRSSWVLNGVSKSGWRSTTVNSGMVQTVSVIPNTLYTYSLRVRKPFIQGYVVARIYTYGPGGTGTYVEKVAPATSTFDGELIVKLPPMPTSEIQVAVFIDIPQVNTDVGVEITDLMLKDGTGTVWQQSDGEIYGTDVSLDADGIQVARRDPNTNASVGKTVITPYEFAGYNGDNKVFTLNEDITEVEGLKVKSKGLYVPPIKMVQNLAGNLSLDIVWTGKE